MPQIPSNELWNAIHFSSIVTAMFILAASVFLSKVTETFKIRIQSKFPEYRLLTEQVITVLRFFILLFGLALSALAIFGFSKKVIVAIGGSMAVAIGFGLKDVAASILSGFLILFERPFQVGDRVAFGETYGDVVSIGLRSTQVRTLDDSTVTIPNNKFITESVLSANGGALDMMAQIDFYISTDDDLDDIKSLIRQCVISSRYVFLKKPFVIMFAEVFHNNLLCTQIRIKAYIIETKYEKPFQTDLTIRLREVFNKHNIRRPYSQMDVNSKEIVS